MNPSVIDRLKADSRMAEALSFVLGQTITPNQTKAIRCLNPSAHKNGDRHPSMIVLPDSGSVSCRACGLALGLFDLAVHQNLAPDKQAAAKAIEERFYGTPTPATSNGHVTTTGSPQWPYFPKAAERIGWTVFEEDGRTAIRCPTVLPSGDHGRTKIRFRKAESLPTARFETDAKEIGLLHGDAVINASAGSEHPEIALLAGETDLLAWTHHAAAEGIECPAASSAMGEQNPLKAAASMFRGCHVVVLYDNDPVGKEHGPKRAKELLEAGAASAVSIHVPDPHKDVCDYLRAGGTVRALLAAAEKARSAEAPKKCLWDLAFELTQPPPEPPDMLIEDLVTRQSVNIVFGPPSSGKSWCVMQVALQAATIGGAFMGNESVTVLPNRSDTGEPTDRILWVFGSEDTEHRIHTRFRTLIDGLQIPTHMIRPGIVSYATPPGGTTINSDDGRKWLLSTLDATKPTIVVFDTVASLTGETLDPSKAEHVVPFMRELHRLRNERGLTIFALHHTRKESQDAKKAAVAKADSMLGSQAWRSMSDSILMLNATDGNTSDVTVRCVKAKDIEAPAKPFHAAFTDGRFIFLNTEGDDAPPPLPQKPGARSKVQTDVIRQLLAENPQGVPWNTLHERLAVARSVWYANRGRVLEELAGFASLKGRLLVPDNLL